MFIKEFITTKDGSHTVKSNFFDATYHSIHGAIEESIHVFISSGLYYQYRNNINPIHIFEMGFGTGLNAYLSLLSANKHEAKVIYHTIEKFPLLKDDVKKLNFVKEIGEYQSEPFYELHKCNWNEEVTLSENFKFLKIESDIELIQFDQKYDVIYFDAFAPSCQAILWEKKIHQKLYNALNNGGCLVTYCAQGKFKRMLKSLGYSLDKLTGPGRKHEMTRAIKL